MNLPRHEHNQTKPTLPYHTDHRNLALEGFAADLVELDARLRDVEGERDTYRELLQLSLAELHILIMQNRRLRACLRRNLDQRFREAPQRQPRAA